MKKRILAIALAILMLLPVVPMSVSAAGEALVVTGGERDKDYTYEGGVLTVHTATPITIKNADSSVATTDHIVVKKDISANITLAGVNISANVDSSFSPFMIEDDSTGDVTVILAEGTENTLNASAFMCFYVGLQKNGNGADIGKLTIAGTGKLTAIGGMNSAGIGGSNNKSASNITISGGTVEAKSSGWAAGIGGGMGGSGSYITITGGTVTAQSSQDGGAGIGGGTSGDGSNITISGGVVKATGGNKGAGIGGGTEADGSYITISGGTVTAKCSEGAGIGGGMLGNASNITISGGSVHITDSMVDIGGIDSEINPIPVTPKNGTSEVYLLTIPNPDKKAIVIDNKVYKPFNHSAIDGDTNLYAYVTGTEHTVLIGDTKYKYTYENNVFTQGTGTPITEEANPQFDIKVTESGGTAVFGTDYYYVNGTLSIVSDEDVTISNKSNVTTASHRILIPKDIDISVTLNGVNISTSSNSPFKIDDNSTGDVTVTLAANSENTLTSTGYDYAGLQKNGNIDGIGKLTITGTGKLTATSGHDGAGIGGGYGASGSNITISGGTVTAQGGEYGGAGIGGGSAGDASSGDGSYITISGGTVTANGGGGGAGIGGGDCSSGSNITIFGGTVTATGGSFGGAGIGGGISSSGSNITISGGSVRAIKGEDANDIGGGSGRAAVTPKNAEEHDVYLMKIPNPSNAKMYIDNAEYTPSNHTAADSNDTNLYAYVTGLHHTVKVGTETSCYHFVNNAFEKHGIGNSLMNDANGHWYACSDDTCTVKHDFAAHTFDQVVDPKFETGVEANCQHGTEYYKSCICGVKGTVFYDTDVDSSNHVGTLGNWQMTDGEHWKEYSECGCKENKGVHKDENPADHKCDDCEKILSEHELNDHPEYKPDCTHNGMIAHYSCMHCGKLFADENAENEITDSDIVVPATGHSYENGECVNCGARDPEISKVRAFFLDIFKLIVRIIKDFPVWIQTLPEAFIGLFR